MALSLLQLSTEYRVQSIKYRVAQFRKSLYRNNIAVRALTSQHHYFLRSALFCLDFALQYTSFGGRLCEIRVTQGKTQAGIYLLKVNNRNTRAGCEICSKLTIKTPERCQWCRSGVFIVNFAHTLHLVLLFLQLTLKI